MNQLIRNISCKYHNFRLYFKCIDHTIKYCVVPSGGITAVVQSRGGTTQYLVGISIVTLNNTALWYQQVFKQEFKRCNSFLANFIEHIKITNQYICFGYVLAESNRLLLLTHSNDVLLIQSASFPYVYELRG
jgi:hypothetical protein